MNMQDDPPQDNDMSCKDVIEDNGIFEEIVGVTDIGDITSEAGPFGIDYAKITFFEFFFGRDEVKAWDVDLGEFLNDVEDESGIVLKQSDVKPWDVDLGEFLKNLYLYSVKFLYKQPVSTIVAGLAFVCLLVAAVSLVLLISTFLGYV